MKNIESCNDAADTIVTAVLFFLIVALALGMGVGWVLNIVKLAPMEGATGMLVLRAVGILFAPLGMVLGYVG